MVTKSMVSVQLKFKVEGDLSLKDSSPFLILQKNKTSQNT